MIDKHSLEKGSREKIIKISINKNLLKGGSIEKIIDGNTGCSDTWLYERETNGWLKFEFPIQVSITGVIWYQSDIADQHVWGLYGSNNDKDYYLIADNLHLGIEITTKCTFKNDKKYKYYKLQQLSGESTNSPYINEIEFIITIDKYIINMNNNIFTVKEENKCIESSLTNINDWFDIDIFKNNIPDILKHNNYYLYKILK